ncbi:MAG: hypothetical protein IT160_00485 [Bryobacterales bacterium]|nr:hypothetical protein [Bryobacterales bacterium]
MKLAEQLRSYCVRGERCPPDLVRRLVERAASDSPQMAAAATEELFRDLVEPLSDAFEPRYCDAYAELFCGIVALVYPEVSAASLLERYGRIRRPRPIPRRGVNRIVVLSRVTLGADVAITSVMLDAAKRAFPEAQIIFAGSAKARELFAMDGRIGHLPLEYGRRATLCDRLSIWPELQPALSQPGTVVIDPDSRLTQLGVLPVCPEENYYFFESRACGGQGSLSLSELASDWCRETFGVECARPWIAPLPEECCPEPPFVAISLGVGENQGKRLADPFEEMLVRSVLDCGAFVVIDKGAPGEEMERVERLVDRLPAFEDRLFAWEGSFAAFASIIGRASMYLGYDSSGQHVAAACGVPRAVVFHGFAGERTLQRWKPVGAGTVTVVRGDRLTPGRVLEEMIEATREARATERHFR